MKIRRASFSQMEMSEKTHSVQKFARLSINIDCEPILESDTLTCGKNIITTSGNYCLIYDRKFMQPRNPRPFRVACDIAHDPRVKMTRLFGWDEFIELSEKNPYVGFIRKFSTLAPRHFRLAMDNPRTPIPFTFDIIKYVDYLGGTKLTTNEQVEQANEAYKNHIKKILKDKAEYGKRWREEHKKKVEDK